MSLPAPVADRLGKLVPRLASEHPGEVLGTVAAIRRSLSAQRLDLHDLARSLVAAQPEPKIVVIYRDRPNPDPTTWSEVAKWCCDHEAGRLADHERKFVHDMAARLICGGEPTERQGAWLRAIYAKLRAAR